MTRFGPNPAQAILALAVLVPLHPSGLGADDAPGTQPTRERPRVLTLAIAIQEGLGADPSIGAAAETVTQAEADVRTASQPPNPSLSLSRTLIPFGSAFTPDRQGGPTQLELELSYPLDWFVFGKRGEKRSVE